MTPIKKPTTEELTEKYKPLVADPFTVLKVDACNFRPRPFMIGPRHFPNQNEGIYIMPEKAPCAIPGCGLLFSEHTHDTVLFLKLTRNASNKEASAALMKIKEEMLADKIDGVCMVETTEKFRVKA